MGQSMIQSLLNNDTPPKRLLICDHHPEALKSLSEKSAVDLIQDPFELACRSDVVILAVKPQSMLSVLTTIKGFDSHKTPLLMSIAAGVTSSALRGPLALSDDYPLVRVMPNTPALIQAGISGLFTDSQLSKENKQLSECIMGAIGKWVWIEEESQMDVVTALSGSGPAYFFLFMEELIKGATKLGLPEATAHQLCLETGLGALTMAQTSSDSLEQLRTKVTSKGGTTEAAVQSMLEDKIGQILMKALSKATQRGKELSQALEQNQNHDGDQNEN